EMAFRKHRSDADRRGRNLVVGPGVTALGVKERGARSVANAASDATECINSFRQGDAQCSCGIGDVSASSIDFETKHDRSAHLPVVTDRTAAKAAVHVAAA